VILEGVVPLIVDGGEVDVTVVSVWQDPPSPVPAVFGAVAGAAVAAALVRRRIRSAAALVAVAAAAATAVGAASYLSVPSETGPAWSLWAPPVVALVLALAPLLPGRMGRMTADRTASLVLVAAAVLVVWGAMRWSWLWAAVIPAGVPFWADRLVTALALTAGVGAAILAIRETVSPRRGA
jgi:hypothetical protein